MGRLGGLHDRACPPARGRGPEKGAPANEPGDHAIGRSRGGLTTKIHLAADGHCRPLAFVLTAGQAGDAPAFADVMAGLRVPRLRGRPRTRPDLVLADKAYSSRAIREHLRKRGIRAVIPVPADQQGHRLRRGSQGGRPPVFDRETYKQRNTVERCINRHLSVSSGSGSLRASAVAHELAIDHISQAAFEASHCFLPALALQALAFVVGLGRRMNPSLGDGHDLDHFAVDPWLQILTAVTNNGRPWARAPHTSSPIITNAVPATRQRRITYRRRGSRRSYSEYGASRDTPATTSASTTRCQSAVMPASATAWRSSISHDVSR